LLFGYVFGGRHFGRRGTGGDERCKTGGNGGGIGAGFTKAMFSFAGSLKVFVAVEACDMRMGLKYRNVSYAEFQSEPELLNLLLVGLFDTAFPLPNRRSGNSHFLRELPTGHPILVTLDLNEVSKRFYARGQWLTTMTGERNMSA
jgi:hypothetical protein